MRAHGNRLFAGRRYSVDVSGVLNNDTGNACAYRVYWAAGATVTTSGTVALEVPCCTTQGFGQAVRGRNELCTANSNAFTAGQVTLALYAVYVTGAGNSHWGDGATKPSILSVTDIGV